MTSLVAPLQRQAVESSFEVLALRIPAGMLIAFGLVDETDLTDALFAIVHPELRGGRIPAEEKGLQQEWRRIRRLVARPALQSRRQRRGDEPAPDKPMTAADTPKPAPPASSAKSAEPWDPAKSKPIPAKHADLAAKHPDLAEEFLGLKPAVRAAFDRKGGFKHYVAIRPLYAKRLGGGASPVPHLNKLEFDFEFCGDTLQGLDPRVTARLREIEPQCLPLVKRIKADGVPVKFEGAFQPRATTDKPNNLSDHALGLALHLNYSNNPYIGRLGKTGSQAAKIIERIAAEAGQTDFWGGLRQRKKETDLAHVERSYHAYAAASDAVKAYFQALDTGDLAADEAAKRKKEYEVLEKAHAGRDPKRGFFAHTAHFEGDPMLQLIKLLTITAGLQWGGQYRSRPKDLHHFALKVKEP